MSKHTTEYLHENQRVGFGYRAWWFNAAVEAVQAIKSHYETSVPLAEVRRLFDTVKVGRGQTFVTYIDSDGKKQTVKDERWAPVMNIRTGDVFGHFSRSSDWRDFNVDLTDNVSALVGGIGDLGVETCGILDFGARAYLSVGIPESMHDDKSGVTFRPRLFAGTALDGSLATTYKRVVTLTVCDNTMAAALGETGETVKVKHTKNSGVRIKDARQALGILSETADAFSAEIAALTTTEFSDENFNAFLSTLAPVTEGMSKHAVTHAENKRDAYLSLWRNDNRVSPWRGTLFGALQADNTYRQHIAIRRGAGDTGDKNAVRAERNVQDILTGKIEEADTSTLAILHKVLATA